ncbi:hypothetical protein LXT12_26310 [Pelomonas sp. P7]|uniref:Transposase n=1 Tax=Pelomonas caseinilytica TaxID=2906763 RepID=A0ABS8XPB0_9BURK|nr:hypothetical protein [Pelomonas sp. P7]MCE4540747.1 hypothetical protein [Pelomonas sp. P7]
MHALRGVERVRTDCGEVLHPQAHQAAQQYETLRARATDLEQRNGELERRLSGATATAQSQSQGDMITELLARISPPAPAGKTKVKAPAVG